MSLDTADNVAAPASSGASAPASSGNITSGTASEALIKAATAASSADTAPAGQTAGDTLTPTGGVDPSAPAGATAQPGLAGPADPTSATSGPVPTDRHIAAVKNAREKGIAEGEAKFAWAKSISPQTAQEIPVAMNILSQLRGDAKDFVTRLAGELGLTVVPANGAGGKEETFEADLESQDGKMKAYSAGMVDKVVARAVQKATETIRGEMQPFVEFTGSEQEKAQQRDLLERNRQTASTVLTEARELPHFKEHEKAIAEKLKGMDVEVKKRLGPVAALYRAYNLVLSESVLPTINVSAAQRVRDENIRKAAASHGAHPTDSGNDGKAPVLRDGDVSGLARHLEQLEKQATA